MRVERSRKKTLHESGSNPWPWSLHHTHVATSWVGVCFDKTRVNTVIFGDGRDDESVTILCF